MTREKNRYTTQEKLWKLDDEQLTTPKHDEMVLWLLNKENVLKVIPELMDFFSNNTQCCTILTDRVSDTLVNGLTKIPNLWEKIYTGIQSDDMKLEYPDLIKKNSDYYWREWNRLLSDFATKPNIYLKRDMIITSENPILARNGYIIGYWDILIKFNSQINDNGCIRQEIRGVANNLSPVYIEVKPKITSFGSTLRQLKTYQSYVPESINRTYLFTTDTGFKTAFESQGIKVIEYRPSS